MLYCILGSLGSGKTSVIDALVKDEVCKQLMMETTNPAVLLGNDKSSYTLVTEEYARSTMFWGGAVEVRKYTIGKGSYFYYTTKKSIEKICSGDYIVKCTPAQFSSYYNAYRGYVFPIILTSSDKERLLREILICKTTMKSICEKFIEDPYEVSSDIFTGLNSCHIIKNEDLDITINNIRNVITKNKNDVRYGLYYTFDDTILTHQELFDAITFESLKNVIDLEVQIL